jgi:hypothetical protein
MAKVRYSTDDKTLEKYEGDESSFEIPYGVTNIGDEAFEGCSGLTSLVIPESVESIGSSAFSGCSGLTSLVIPESVTSIEWFAFSGCSGLNSITVASNNPCFDSRENCNAIIDTQMNTLIAGCKNTLVPDSVTSIGDSAFWGCSGLTSLVIPESVTNIGDKAFSGCSGLTSIKILNKNAILSEDAFEGCSDAIHTYLERWRKGII